MIRCIFFSSTWDLPDARCIGHMTHMRSWSDWAATCYAMAVCQQSFPKQLFIGFPVDSLIGVPLSGPGQVSTWSNSCWLPLASSSTIPMTRFPKYTSLITLHTCTSTAATAKQNASEFMKDPTPPCSLPGRVAEGPSHAKAANPALGSHHLGEVCSVGVVPHALLVHKASL